MKYRVEFKRSAAKAFKKIPGSDLKSIQKTIDMMAKTLPDPPHKFDTPANAHSSLLETVQRAASPQKRSGSNSTVRSVVEERSPSVKAAAQEPAAKIKPDYDRLLTQKALSRFNRNPVRVKRIQNGLITAGYDTGPIDGVIGPQHDLAAVGGYLDCRIKIAERLHPVDGEIADRDRLDIALVNQRIPFAEYFVI